ncbi:nucleotidyltransferase domain-containing protein [Candidatus Uhrbacteria bacterium]|nr:nucleotidyltransferase domain-containing protein [Candidatus Uhrbacteria bacterium]
MFHIQSQLRRKLLVFYFADVTRVYHLRELARILHVDPTNLSRELKTFEKQGLFFMETRGRQKWFSLNTHHPLFSEFKTIIAKTIGVVGALRAAFSKMSKVQCALLYGSFAKGEEDAMSDIDILIVGSIREDEITAVIVPLEKQFGRDINVVHYTPKEFLEKKKHKEPLLQSIFSGKYELIVGHV